MANERSFEALYNGHRFSYASMIGVYKKYPNENAKISKEEIYEFYLENEVKSFYSLCCKI